VLGRKALTTLTPEPHRPYSQLFSQKVASYREVQDTCVQALTSQSEGAELSFR
jgi:hypothetical protein